MRIWEAAGRAWGRVLTVALLVAAGLMACDDEPTEDEDLARLQAMEVQIRASISASSCEDSSDCAVIALGAKPCGGPWGYLVYSRAATDTVALSAMAARYTEFNEILNRRWGWISTCDLQPVPEVACEDGRCVDRLGLYAGGIPP